MTFTEYQPSLCIVKILTGPHAPDPNDAVENYRRYQRLLAEMERLRPYKKPRGAYKFRTWEEHDEFVRTRAARQL